LILSIVIKYIENSKNKLKGDKNEWLAKTKIFYTAKIL
jgi:hypothetical protein